MVKTLRILKEKNCLTLLIQHFPKLFDHCSLSFVNKAFISSGNSVSGEMLKVSKLEGILKVTKFYSPLRFCSQFQCVDFSPTHMQAVLRHHLGVLHYPPGDSIRSHPLRNQSYKTVSRSDAKSKSSLLPGFLMTSY